MKGGGLVCVQVQVLLPVQVHVPNVVVCEFHEGLCACARAGAESGAGQLQVQFQEQVPKFSIK